MVNIFAIDLIEDLRNTRQNLSDDIRISTGQELNGWIVVDRLDVGLL